MAHSNILVIYYSRTGTTRNIVEELKKELNCDVEEVIDKANRSGIIGFLKSGYAAAKGKTTEVENLTINPSGYDVIILATPVWASHITPAIRTYLLKYKGCFNTLAYISTQSGAGQNKIQRDIEGITGKSPISKLNLTKQEIVNGEYKEKIKEFTKYMHG